MGNDLIPMTPLEAVIELNRQGIGTPMASGPTQPPGAWVNVAGTSLGDQISERNVLTIGTYFACIRNIAQDIATLPFRLLKKESRNGRKASVEMEDSLAYLLSVAPNPRMTAYKFWEMMFQFRSGWGNAYAEKVFNRTQTELKQLWPLHPSRVIPKLRSDGLVNTYEIYNDDGTTSEIPRDRMFHLMNLSGDGRVGYSILKVMQNTLEESNDAARFSKHSLKNMARPFMVLQTDEILKDQARQELKAQMSELYAGANNAGKTLVIDNGLKVSGFQCSAEDMQLLELRMFTKEQLAEAFRMPLRKLQHIHTAQGWSTLDAEESDYINSCLAPIIKDTEQSIRQQLMPISRYPSNIDPHFEVKGRLKGDLKSRGEFYKTLFFMGGVTPNEIRAMEDMNPLEDPAMDKTYLQGATIPLNMAGKVVNAPEPEKSESVNNATFNRITLNGVH